MSRGKWTLDVGLLHSPERFYRARTASQEDVNRLADSFSTYVSKSEQSMVVLFWPEDQPLPAADWNLHEWLASAPDGAVDGFFVIIGDHTQRAIKQLHEDFPQNAFWNDLLCEVLVCTRGAENYATLKSWGILDNVKGETRTGVDFVAKICSLHEDFLTICESIPEGKVRAKAMARRKAARASEYGMPANSMGQLWGLATKTGEVWDALHKILIGDVTSAKFKRARSASNFTCMGGIPDADLAPMLRRVVSGSRTLKEFTRDCKMYKASARVQREILEFLGEDRWDVAEAKFPYSCAVTFVETWAAYIVNNRLPNKRQLPASFVSMLSKKQEQDRTVNAANAMVARVSENHHH